ncbi:MAG: hypothetical protein ACRDL8_03280 [Solirubrobacteraceae bacterium]
MPGATCLVSAGPGPSTCGGPPCTAFVSDAVYTIATPGRIYPTRCVRFPDRSPTMVVRFPDRSSTVVAVVRPPRR